MSNVEFDEKCFYVVTCSCKKYEFSYDMELTCKNCGREPVMKKFSKKKDAEDYYKALPQPGALMHISDGKS